MNLNFGNYFSVFSRRTSSKKFNWSLFSNNFKYSLVNYRGAVTFSCFCLDTFSPQFLLSVPAVRDNSTTDIISSSSLLVLNYSTEISVVDVDSSIRAGLYLTEEEYFQLSISISTESLFGYDLMKSFMKYNESYRLHVYNFPDIENRLEFAVFDELIEKFNRNIE